jgi:ADP-heptose:LPS heptosyltransferase
MFCCHQAQPPPTLIPNGVRDALGTLLRGPLRASQRRTIPVCLFALGRLGDFVLTLSALRLLLQESVPDSCLLVIPAPLAGLAARELPGVRQITLPMEAASLFREIVPIWRSERPKFATDRFERLVCFSHQRSLYYELALSWIDARQDFRLLPETYPQAPADGLSTELLGHWRLAETVLGRPVPRADILPQLTSLQATEDGRLLVCPFSRDIVRNLPADTTIQALRLWRDCNKSPIILGGSPADVPALEQLATAARAARITDVTVEAPAGLDGLLEQIAKAGAVFAADSAPAHVAAALDKRSVVMTSRSFYGYAQPWSRSDRQQVFVHGTPLEQIAAALSALCIES